MNTTKEIKLPTVAKVELSLEAISILENKYILPLSSNPTQQEILNYFAEVAISILRGKFITPTIFDADKRQILSVKYSHEIKRFTVYIVGEPISNELHFEFDQLDELLQIGATQEDELDSVNNCYFIVK